MHDCHYPIDTEQEYLISGEDPDNKEDVKRAKNRMKNVATEGVQGPQGQQVVQRLRQDFGCLRV